jgi:hypothetical protein
VRSASPIKINEVRFSAGANPTNQFVELYNASSSAVDLSRWTVINTPGQWAPVVLATIPPGTRLAGGQYYLLGLSTSGLTAPARAGDITIQVRSTAGLSVGQRVDIDGEGRTLTGVATPSAAMTTVFIPVSSGPWITIEAGSSNLPVANATGFEAGQKVGIDLGGRYEVAMVTHVGKAATQTTLTSAAAAGATMIKVAASANMTPGDTLTVGTGGRKEALRIKSVGSADATGASVDLAAPLRFDHGPGVDVSDRGTGISFSPATRFAHTSGDAVQALGGGVTLDRALSRSHAAGAPVRNATDTTAGYQGTPAPSQWFGAPLSARAGSIALMDSTGKVVVDAVVYGSQQSNSSGNGTIASPELATLEADQGGGGCIAVVPAPARGGGPAASTPDGSNRSLGRYPDGADTDNLCADFLLQAATTMPLAASAGAVNIKVASVAGLVAGQTVTLDTGPNIETVVLATVGSSGGTTMTNSTAAGAVIVPVASVAGFTAGQTLTIDSGTSKEDAVIAAVAAGGRGGGAMITVAAPLAFPHAAGAMASGTGVTLMTPLARGHAPGAQVAGALPTPGTANRYSRPRG